MGLRHEDLLRRILLLDLPNTRLWKNETGAAFRDGHMVRYGLKGSADILGVTYNGKIICIEVKVGRDSQSLQQQRFQAMIEKHGGYYLVSRSTEDVLEFFSKINPEDTRHERPSSIRCNSQS